MSLFSGPSISEIKKISLGIMGCYMQIEMLQRIDDGAERNELISRLKASREPTRMDELTISVVTMLVMHRFGWFKIHYFLGMLESLLTQSGVSRSHAADFKKEIHTLLSNHNKGM